MAKLDINNIINKKQSGLFSLICAILLLALAILLAVPPLLPIAKMKQKIDNHYIDANNGLIAINGRVYFELLPYPRLVLEDVKLNHFAFGGNIINANIDKLLLGVGINTILGKNSNITTASINGATINITKFLQKNELDENNDKNIISPSLMPSKLRIQNSTINYFGYGAEKERARTVQINHISFSHYMQYEPQIAGKIMIGTSWFNFEGKFPAKGKSADFAINGSGIAAMANIIRSTDDKISGNLKLSAKNIKPLLMLFYDEQDIFVQDFTGDYLNAEAKIESSGDIVIIDKIVIDSPVLAGSGKMNWNRNKSFIDLTMQMKQINIDKLMPSRINETNKTSQYIENIKRYIYKNDEDDYRKILQSWKEKGSLKKNTKRVSHLLNSLSNKHIAAVIDIKSEKAIYNNEKLTNLNLEMNRSSRGDLFLGPLSFNTDGEGEVLISGSLSEDENGTLMATHITASGADASHILPLFDINSLDFNINLSKKKWGFAGDVIIGNSKTVIPQFKLTLDNSAIIGTFTIDTAQKVPFVNGNLAIDRVIIPHYSNFYDLLTGHVDAKSQQNLANKMLWLNMMPLNGIVKIEIGNLTFAEDFGAHNSVALNAEVKIDGNSFAINQFNAKSADIDIGGKLEINSAATPPLFNLTIAGSNLTINQPDAPPIPTPALDKTKISPMTKMLNNFIASTILSQFFGKVNIDIEQIHVPELPLSSIKLDGELTNGELDIGKCSGMIFGGRFAAQGNFVFGATKAISSSFAITNADLSQISQIFAISTINGYSNISGKFSTYGSDRVAMLKQLDGVIQLSLSKVSIPSFTPHLLVAKMLDVGKYQSELRNPSLVVSNALGNSTVFANGIAQLVMKKSDALDFNIKLDGKIVNGLISGNLWPESRAIDAKSSFIFATGVKTHPVQITIASSVNGALSAPKIEHNFSQVLQYVNTISPIK